jgi:predicted site-specific integrase-resolvase
VAAVAELFGVKKVTVNGWVLRGVIETPPKLAGRYYWTPEAVAKIVPPKPGRPVKTKPSSEHEHG